MAQSLLNNLHPTSLLFTVRHPFQTKVLGKSHGKIHVSSIASSMLSQQIPQTGCLFPNIGGGIGIYPFVFEQTISQVKLFIGLSWTRSELLNLFNICVNYFYLHAGTEACPFS